MTKNKKIDQPYRPDQIRLHLADSSGGNPLLLSSELDNWSKKPSEHCHWTNQELQFDRNKTNSSIIFFSTDDEEDDAGVYKWGLSWSSQSSIMIPSASCTSSKTPREQNQQKAKLPRRRRRAKVMLAALELQILVQAHQCGLVIYPIIVTIICLDGSKIEGTLEKPRRHHSVGSSAEYDLFMLMKEEGVSLGTRRGGEKGIIFSYLNPIAMF